MFSRKKKSKPGPQGPPDIAIEDGIDWTAQHHTRTQGATKKIPRSHHRQQQPQQPQHHHNYPSNHHGVQSSSHPTHQHQQQAHQHLEALQPPSAFSITPRNGSMTMLSSSNIEYPLSGDESDHVTHITEMQRSRFYATDPQKRTKEYHLQQALNAVELLKVAAKPTGWKKIDKHKSGCIVYQSTATSDKHVAFKGEHVIRGHRAQDVFAAVGVRKLWDDWYDELSCIENYDDSTSLMYMVMKSNLSSKTRDVAMVERIETERDGTIYFAGCSVESNKVPPVPGKVRADIFIAGWVIQPLPSNPPITRITYVIQTDLLSRLPKFIAKRSLIKRAMSIATIETHLKKNGVSVATTNTPTAPSTRPRSLSEPLKLGVFESVESDEDGQSGSAFLSPLIPSLEPEDEVHEQDYTGTSAVDSSSMSMARHSLAPSAISSNTLFTAEFLENNSFMSDSALFGDTGLFGNGGIFEPEKKPEDAQPVKTTTEARTKTTQSSKSKSKSKGQDQAKVRPHPAAVAVRPQPVEQDIRSRQSQKRVSIPVVQPKSDARMKQYQQQQPTVPEQPVHKTIPTSTPPLTPTASLDGKDATSDSDTALSPELKPVPRATKALPSPTSPTIETDSKTSSMAMSSFGMKTPSAMMEARRHSGMLNRGAMSNFVPRHSHVVPIRGNPNVSLQSLTRPSGPNGTMTSTIKRHSSTLSIESSRSTTAFAPSLVLPHRHSETARKALAMFKVLASSSEDRWRAISSENGFKAYSRVISGAGLPMLRGEGTITGGWTVEQINAVIESSGCRQIWDDRFDNLSIAETFNHNEYLFHITLKGVGSLTGRDLAGVTIVDRDPQTSALYNVSTSVLDPTIPENPGRIRAMLELSGWSLRPTFDGQGNTVSVNVTFVVQIDIRGTLPSSVVKSMTSSMTMAVARLNQFINKTGYPPFASHISGTRLLDTFEPQTGFYELCYKAAPGWTEVRVGRKVYREGYDFFIKPDDPTVKVELAPDFGGVRIWTTLDHEGQSIVAQVSRKGQYRIEPEHKAEETVEETKVKHVDEAVQVDMMTVTKKNQEVVDTDATMPNSRKRRSASYATPSTPFAPATRPDSQASIASKASQSSEKSGRRGRARTVVALPAGTLAPPLPRRSSSLSRYSIPISPYAPEDAPPVPVNTTITSGILASVGARTSSLAASTPDITPTASTPSSLVVSSRPVSDALASPTLGPFHVPHRPAAVPRLSTETRPIVPTPTPIVTPATAPMESINTVLSDMSPTSPSSVSELELEPVSVEVLAKEDSVTVVAVATAASVPVTSAAVTVTATTASVTAVKALEVDTTIVHAKEVHNKKTSIDSSTASSPIPSFRATSTIKEISASLANIASPAASPVPTQNAMFVSLQPATATSAVPTATATAPTATAVATATAAATATATATSTATSTATAAATAATGASRLKHSASSMSVGGTTRRVTFSLDTIDDSKDSKTMVPTTSVVSSSPLDEIVKLKSVLKDHSTFAASTPHAATVHTVKVVEVKTTESHSSQICGGENSEYESDEAEFVEARDEMSEVEEEQEVKNNNNNNNGKMEEVVLLLSAQEQQDITVDRMLSGLIRWIEELASQLTANQIKFGIVFLLLIYYAGRLSPLIAFA
ncbi:hypothetical protein BG004_003897 [Podila humilis]|nr:hypothetical protein BG004_003897 [Podila humilis]